MVIGLFFGLLGVGLSLIVGVVALALLGGGSTWWATLSGAISFFVMLGAILSARDSWSDC
jgi:Flp pilus assembly pilin Flp